VSTRPRSAPERRARPSPGAPDDHGPAVVPPRSSDGPRPEIPPIVFGARSVARHALRPVLALWLRLRVEGLEHVPADGPVLLASTHQSHADSLALGVAVPRPVRFLGDARHLGMPVLGPHLPRLGMVPLQRGQADASALDVIAGLLDDGAAVAVYPEGSRSRDGRVHRLRSGVARIAAASGAPVVPAAVAGIYDVWPIGSRPRLRGGRVTVRFGPPMAAPGDTPRERRDFTQDLHRRLAELAGAEMAADFSPIGGGA
jgi:1-acyl-sn-glycerol-3-phosphate acyltransferase